MSEHKKDDLADVEMALRGFSPRASHIERDRLMFLAGQASVRPSTPARSSRQWIWPSATAAMALVSFTLAMFLWRAERTAALPINGDHNVTAKQPSRNNLVRVTAHNANVESGPARPESLGINRALTHGIDTLADMSMYASPSHPSTSNQRSQSQRELLDNLLEEPTRPAMQPSSFLIELFRLSGENS